jgi:peptide/nickel transport system permease protein
MQAYIRRRLILAIPTLLGVTVLIFYVMRILPGDPLALVFGAEGDIVKVLNEEELKAAKASLGLDKPLVLQYLDWLSDLLRGHLGTSFWRGDSVSELVMRRGPMTVQIAVMAVFLSWIVGLPIGVLSAARRNSIGDYISRFFAILFLAVPSFWIGIVVVTMGVVVAHWQPPIGINFLWDGWWKNLQTTFFPAMVLALGMSAVLARFARSSLLEVLRQDYVRTARAKGLVEKVVLWRHALRNALPPVITVSGLQLSGLLGGSVVVERAFNVPGLGSALIAAINQKDWMIIQNLTLLYGVVFVLANLLVDLSYAFLDPRIRYD